MTIIANGSQVDQIDEEMFLNFCENFQYLCFTSMSCESQLEASLSFVGVQLIMPKICVMSKLRGSIMRVLKEGTVAICVIEVLTIQMVKKGSMFLLYNLLLCMAYGSSNHNARILITLSQFVQSVRNKR